MKKFVLFCLALAMGVGVCAAAGKPAAKKIVTTVFVTDIDCDHCVKKIMNNVPSLGKGIKDVKVEGGCSGNLQGISRLVVGMKATDAIERMQGISCGGKPTSCPDQLAKALTEALKKAE